MPKKILDNPDIFQKNYAWKYEQECRLVIRLSDKWRKKAESEKLGMVCIDLKNGSLKIMRERGIVRSPIYCGGVESGHLSKLAGSVEWDIETK